MIFEGQNDLLVKCRNVMKCFRLAMVWLSIGENNEKFELSIYALDNLTPSIIVTSSGTEHEPLTNNAVLEYDMSAAHEYVTPVQNGHKFCKLPIKRLQTVMLSNYV